MRARERGQVLIVFALVLFILMGFAALAVDVGFMFTVRNQLQRCADSGALAGASGFLGGGWDNTNLFSPPMAASIARARDYATRDNVGTDPLDDTLEVGVTFPYVDRIRVETHRTVNLIFAYVFWGGDTTISAFAVAERVPGSPPTLRLAE